MSTLETPEQVAARVTLYRDRDRENIAAGIRADREQTAARCEQKASEAQRESDAHARMVTGAYLHEISDASHRERAMFCEGQASALRAVAAMLRGAK